MSPFFIYMMQALNKIENFLEKPWKRTLLFILWALFITNLWLPRNWGFYGQGDWDLTYSTFECARKSIMDYGQWPGFNPYLAFGSDMDANPQGAHASVFFIPILLFGSFYGFKISILLAIFIGLLGMRKLLLRTGSGNLNATLVSMAFCSASFFARHILEVGHSNFLYFYLIPYLMEFIERFRQKKKRYALALATIILSQFISGGAPLVFIVSVFMIILWSAYLWISREESFKWLLNVLLLFVFSIGLSLWKIIPVLDQWSVSPRNVLDDSGINPLVFLDALADFKTDTKTPHDWHEFSIGTGLLAPLLILYFWKNIPKFKLWLIMTLFIVWLSMGNFPGYANPWYLSHHFLPIFDGLRAPSRFGFIVLFIVSLGQCNVSKFSESKSLIVIILISITLSNTLSYNAISNQMVHSPRVELDSLESSLELPKPVHTFKKDIYSNILKNRLIVDAYEPLHLPEVTDTLNEFNVGSEIQVFSPNKITFKLQQDTSIFNLRFTEHWTSIGAEPFNRLGLLAVKGKPGQEITLQYSNQNLGRGILGSVIFMIMGVLIVLPRWKRKPD